MFYLDYLTTKDIFLDPKIQDKKDLIFQMVRSSDAGSKKKIFEAVIEREQIETTGVGDGIALPHARTRFVHKINVKFALCKNGIDFAAPDHQLVHFIFLIIAPETNVQGYLKTIAHIVKVIKADDVRSVLLHAKTKKEVMKILQQYEGKQLKKRLH